jgi:hypothetical protein
MVERWYYETLGQIPTSAENQKESQAVAGDPARIWTQFLRLWIRELLP